MNDDRPLVVWLDIRPRRTWSIALAPFAGGERYIREAAIRAEIDWHQREARQHWDAADQSDGEEVHLNIHDAKRHEDAAARLQAILYPPAPPEPEDPVLTRRPITDFPGKSGPSVVPAYHRLYDTQQKIIEAAGGRHVDPVLWEYLFAAFLEMHVASITDHIERVEKISRRKDSE